MISVIIPTFNRGYAIKKSVESVLNQGNMISEVIIVDDNSTDDTRNVICSINDSRIKYIKSNVSIGACKARNIGIDISKGELIAFHDSDDIWHKNKIKKQFQILQQENCDIVCSGYNQIYNENTTYIGKNVLSEHIYHELIKENFIGTPTIFGKKECFIKNKFDDNMPRLQDWELMLRLAKEYKIYFFNKPLVDAYIQENSITKSKVKALKALKIILEKNKDFINGNKELLELYYRKIAVFSLYCDEKDVMYFKKAFKVNKNYKTFIDYILINLNLKKILKMIHKC
ncbi:glycosyltransferase family 2 protein [Clostridium sp. Marseille-Q2269]|uniref:glycosyltransferase family 2 protein n=1 Tax=Clostridium sp. Marseille-Q2269 TaxID=2942205 RepID=UPI0020745680|nr:glycosyltransferase family 2 protein [Clostridium sp. Marseille-Q2269]